MKNFLPKLLVLGLVSLTQSCGETVNFDTEEKLATDANAPVGTGGGDAIETPAGEHPQGGTETGNDPDTDGSAIGTDGLLLACHSDKVIAMDAALVFPEIPQGTTCRFGQGDNLSRVDGQIRAYLKQTAVVDLPEGATLCGFALSHDAASMRYDDEMFFSVNDKLLLATKDYTEFFTEKDDFYSFNWEGLKSQYYDSFDNRPVYCAGGAEGLSSCSVPQTETNGQIKLTFSDSMDAILARALQKDRSLSFDWITTGDNDNSDCRHTEINLKLKLRYVKLAP